MKAKERVSSLFDETLNREQAGIVVGFGEINLDIYVRLAESVAVHQGATVKADIEILSGGNTWNITRTLAKLGHITRFVCTTSQNDAIGRFMEGKDEVDLPHIEYIPEIATMAPRFVAVDNAEDPIVRAIHLPSHTPPTSGQLEHISHLLNQFALDKCSVVVLSSSIESSILKHTIQEAKALEMNIVGAVSSAPTAVKFAPLLEHIDVLVLNEFEAQEIAYALGISFKENSTLAEALSKHRIQVVITMGEKGLTACSATGSHFSCSPPSLRDSLVNDLGAGDAFASFLVDAYLRCGEWLSDQTLAWATVGGVLACQSLGHILGSIDHEQPTALYERILEINGL